MDFDNHILLYRQRERKEENRSKRDIEPISMYELSIVQKYLWLSHGIPGYMSCQRAHSPTEVTNENTQMITKLGLLLPNYERGTMGIQ